MLRVLFVILSVMLAAHGVQATTYYVSASGDDGATGLSIASAWRSLDRGDRMGVLQPGDTVFVLPGTYTPTSTMTLSTSGTLANRITYLGSTDGFVVVNGNGGSFTAIQITGGFVELRNIEITNFNQIGILVDGNWSVITGCYLHNIQNDGIQVNGSNCWLRNNLITTTAGKGVSTLALGVAPVLYNNTIANCTGYGIDIHTNVTNARMINNIVVQNQRGIVARPGNVAAFNLVWSNTEGNYIEGIVDSAGGISANPLFLAPGSGDYTLQSGSPAINSGLDLGYPYNGSAPDMGAFESDEPNQPPQFDTVNDTTICEGDALIMTVMATDPENDVLSLSVQNLPTNSDFVDHGDGIGTLEFTPDFDQAGIYTVRFIAFDGELADTVQATITVENTNRAPELTGIGGKWVEEGQTLSFIVNAVDPDGEIPNLTAAPLPINGTFADNGDGTGSFEFTPGYSQEGSYVVVFIASDGSLSDSESVAITVTPAPIAYVRIAPDSATLEVYDSLQFIVTGYDAGDELVSDLTDSVSWSTDDPTGNITSSGLYVAGDVVSPPDYIVTATYAGLLTDTSAVRVISDGSLHYIRIEWLSGIPVGDTSVTTDDDGLTVYCRAYDIGDTPLGDVAVDWSLAVGTDVGSLWHATGTSTSITLTTPGVLRIAVEHASAHVDTSGSFTVSHGAPAKLLVSPDTAVLSVDSTFTFSAATVDADGNATIPQIFPAWTVLGGMGSIDVSGTFTPVTVGDGFIVASSGGEGVPVCPPGLVHYWPLDKSSGPPYPDIAGVADATCIECPSGIAGQVGRALDFDPSGSGDYLSAPSADNLTSALTIMAWVRLDGVLLLRDNGIVSRENAFALEVSAVTNRLSFITYNGANSHVFTPDRLDNRVPNLTWTHVAASFNGTTVAIYINGQLIDSDPAQVASLGSGVSPYEIGRAETNKHFDGRIDEVAVFNRVLLPLEIQQQYQAGVNHQPLCETIVLGLADTTGLVQVVPGALASIAASPDSIAVSSDSSVQYHVEGYDAYGNPRDPGTISFSLTQPIGAIDATGLFQAVSVGTALVMAQSDLGPADTTVWLEVIPGPPQRIEISPTSLAVRIGDSIQFSITGYDANANQTEIGSVDWRALGRIGYIDSTGLFVATAAGKGKVSALSSLFGVADTSDFIDVDELLVSSIPIGTSTVRPGQIMAPLLSLAVRNYFDDAKSLTGLAVRNAVRGPGTVFERLSNIDSIAVYLDTDHDSLLTFSDSLIAWATYDNDVTDVSFSPIVIPADSHLVLLVGGAVNLFARDSDSLDVYCKPASDLVVSDGTTALGADSLNSLGVSVVDGLIAAQLRLVSSTTDTLEPPGGIHHILTVDIPRNGYQPDTLQMFSIAALGTAGPSDFDSLVLYREVSNTVWDDASAELYVGRMSFTGDRWTVTGLAAPLSDPNTRFYVGAAVASFPTNGATLAPYVPINGVQVASGNDGPTDVPTVPIDTFVISTFEVLSVEPVALSGADLIPGQHSGAMLAAKITNTFSSAVVIDSLELQLAATDPHGATQAQLDSQIDSVLLYLTRRDDNTNLIDSLVTTGVISNGNVRLVAGGIEIGGNGGSVTIAVSAAVSLRNARNGNTIGFRIIDEGRLWCSPSAAIEGSFPMSNAKQFTVNAFPLAAVTVHEIQSRSLFGGQVDQLVMDFELPRNGYASDALYQIRLHNRGTANDIAAITTMRLWADDGSGGFSDASVPVGQFYYDGLSWALSAGLYPLIESTTRFYLTVSIATDDRDGGTLDLEIPSQLISFISGTIGPDDGSLSNPHAHVIFQSNRVTAIALPDPGSTVAPGQADVTILTLALYNGYVGRAQTLRSMALNNRTITRSNPAFADSELGQVRLYYDSDRNRVFSGDSLVATGSFAGGTLNLTGIEVALPPESLTYFFAVIDIPENAIDADSLAVSVDNTTDFGFASPVVLNGDFPLQSGGYRIIDGSVRAQYRSLPLDARSLRPGDTLVPVFAFAPAINGDQADVLQSLEIRNLESAVDSDFDRLSLWLDSDADSVWQSGDSLLGDLTGTGGVWTISGLDVTVDGVAPVLFVLTDVSLTATPGAAMRLALPVNGCQYSSANDGPRDAALAAANKFVVSTSGLRITNVPVNETYTVGQSIAITTTVTNVLNQPMDSVFGVCSVQGPLVLDSSRAGPVSLEAGEGAIFAFYYTAQGAGVGSWEVSAYESTIPDSSAVVRTADVLLQTMASNIPLQFVNSIPTAVTRGQTNVFPLSVGVTHTGVGDTTASVQLGSLTITTVTAAGEPQPASHAFSRMALSSGYTTLSAIETVPEQSAITFTFSQPIVVAPGESRLLSLLVDIGESAQASDFVLQLQSASAVPVSDYNTSQPVSLSQALSFPVSTASCRIDDPSEQLAVSYRSLAPSTLNLGQESVPLLQLHLRHPGSPSSSQIQLSALSVSCVDGTLMPVIATDVAEQIRVVRGQTVIGEVSGTSLSQTTVAVNLVSPVTLSPGEIDSIRVVIDAADGATPGSFAMQIADSTQVVVRDLSSGAPLTAVSDTMPLASAVTGFPILTSLASFRHPAVAPQACLASTAGGQVIAGKDSLALLDITLRYPVGSDYSSQQLTSVAAIVTDSLGVVLESGTLFDRIGVSVTPGEVAYTTTVQQAGEYTMFILPDSGLRIDAGDSVTIRLIADVDNDTPIDHFVLRIQSALDIRLYDVSDSTSHTGITIEPGCGGSLPFGSSVIRVLQPAGRPVLTMGATAARLVPRGQRQAPLYDAILTYSSSTPQGDISLEGVYAHVLVREGESYRVGDAALLFDAVHLMIDGSVAATDSIVSGDSLSLTLANGYTISLGANSEIQLVGDIRTDAPLGNFVVAISDSTSLALTDRNVSTSIFAIAQQLAYPLLGNEISVTAGDLEQSFTNYPNPFLAGSGEQTTIGFVLPSPAFIDIEVFTITGTKVIDVVSNEFRAAGAHAQDYWDGRNGAGLDVVPGTYFCRITARYQSGGAETVRRKVAVLR